ncbi:MAG TPA: DinB family protein [Thermoanaerobaculia bacterium]
MEEQLVETWSIHDRIHRYLLDAIPPEALSAVSASKGRTVAEQFAHLHNVRLMWLGSAAPDLLGGLRKLEKGGALDKETLAATLEASADAVAALLRRSLASGGRIKGFKPHAVAFLGYLISHESHHRGQIALTLKQAGHPLDKKAAFGLWEWGVR